MCNGALCKASDGVVVHCVRHGELVHWCERHGELCAMVSFLTPCVVRAGDIVDAGQVRECVECVECRGSGVTPRCQSQAVATIPSSSTTTTTSSSPLLTCERCC